MNRTTLQLLLNPEKDFHKKILDDLTKFIAILDSHINSYHNEKENFDNDNYRIISYKIIDDTRILLYSEWQKNQKLIDNDL